jgi:hypothetical protein
VRNTKCDAYFKVKILFTICVQRVSKPRKTYLINLKKRKKVILGILFVIPGILFKTNLGFEFLHFLGILLKNMFFRLF